MAEEMDIWMWMGLCSGRACLHSRSRLAYARNSSPPSPPPLPHARRWDAARKRKETDAAAAFLTTMVAPSAADSVALPKAAKR